jgi:hypothetical protein
MVILRFLAVFNVAAVTFLIYSLFGLPKSPPQTKKGRDYHGRYYFADCSFCIFYPDHSAFNVLFPDLSCSGFAVSFT